MSQEPLHVVYPILSAFGRRHEFLDSDAASRASTEERIRSIWPFLVRRVLAFQKSLKPRERANYDHEDVMAELWLALAKRDSKWSPELGRYITFAATVINRELCDIRDKARTVHSPRNASCRLKEYQAEEEASTITPERLKTANDIRRTSDPAEAVHDHAHAIRSAEGEPASILMERETFDRRTERLKTAIANLPSDQADVMERTAGLFGRERQTLEEVARDTGRSAYRVGVLKSEAMSNLRRQARFLSEPAA